MPRGTLTCIRVARKEHTCTEKSYHTIRVGDRYLYAAGAPEADWNSSNKWYVIKACLRCANEFGLHTSDTRKQVEQANAPPPRQCGDGHVPTPPPPGAESGVLPTPALR